MSIRTPHPRFMEWVGLSLVAVVAVSIPLAVAWEVAKWMGWTE